MVLRRKNATKRAVYKAKTYARKPVDKAQSQAISALARQVHSLQVSKPLKYFPISVATPQNVSSSYLFVPLSKDIISGVTDNDRIGDTIQGRSIHVKFNLFMQPLVNLALVRVIFFVWKQSYQLAAPNGPDMFDSVNIQSFYNRETSDYFTILHDKIINLQQGVSMQQQVNFHRKMFNKMQWDSGTVLNGPTTNHIWMLIFSDQSAAINVQMTNFESKLYFVDN